MNVKMSHNQSPSRRKIMLCKWYILIDVFISIAKYLSYNFFEWNWGCAALLTNSPLIRTKETAANIQIGFSLVMFYDVSIWILSLTKFHNDNHLHFLKYGNDYDYQEVRHWFYLVWVSMGTLQVLSS